MSSSSRSAASLFFSGGHGTATVKKATSFLTCPEIFGESDACKIGKFLCSLKIKKAKQPSRFLGPHVRLCSGQAYETSDVCSSSVEGMDEKRQGSLTSNEILKRLKRYGISGILSYGLLNTAYYLTTFLLVWFYVAPAPRKMGYIAAAERFVKVMAMVWAGSQVTKLVRVGGALALAPFVDTGLSWFTIKFKFESKGKAFMAIVGSCFGLAVMLFIFVTSVSA